MDQAIMKQVTVDQVIDIKALFAGDGHLFSSPGADALVSELACALQEYELFCAENFWIKLAQDHFFKDPTTVEGVQLALGVAFTVPETCAGNRSEVQVSLQHMAKTMFHAVLAEDIPSILTKFEAKQGLESGTLTFKSSRSFRPGFSDFNLLGVVIEGNIPSSTAEGLAQFISDEFKLWVKLECMSETEIEFVRILQYMECSHQNEVESSFVDSW